MQPLRSTDWMFTSREEMPLHALLIIATHLSQFTQYNLDFYKLEDVYYKVWQLDYSQTWNNAKPKDPVWSYGFYIGKTLIYFS